MMIKPELESLIEPLLLDLGYILWGIEIHSQGRNTLLRIYIDKPLGVVINDCEYVSKQISALLDVEDPILHHYTLEVSSPGIPRPLFKKEQYQAYIGKEVNLKLGRLKDGTKKLTGTILMVTDEDLTMKSREENVYSRQLGVKQASNKAEDSSVKSIIIPFAWIVKAYLIAE